MKELPERIHLLGVGGMGMGALAGLLHQAGVRVTGSEAQEVYPPMGDLLKALKIPVLIGYAPENLEKVAPELVIVGNVIRYDNPEVREVLRRKIPYLSLPEALKAFFLPGKRSLVVAGTHGKTTTSSLLAYVLEHLGEDPTYFVGGLLRHHGRNFRLGKGPWMVFEGDEYDSAFFDKRPKFIHYAPWGAILTSVEYDHADIYPSYDHLKQAFEDFVSLIPEEGLLLVADEKGAREVAKKAKCQKIFYRSQDLLLLERKPSRHPLGQEVLFLWQGQKKRFFLPLIGSHNAENALGVVGLLLNLGFDFDQIAQALETFPGVKRRQEILSLEPIVIDDFAHHPTAVKVTIEAVRETWPERRLIALFEPRTNTSRQKIFQEAYAQVLSLADFALIKAPPQLEKTPPEKRIDLEALAQGIKAQGKEAQAYRETKALWQDLENLLEPDDVVLFMSNGPFDLLPHRVAKIFNQERRGQIS